MNARSFSLQPFPTAGPLPDVKIAGAIIRRSYIIAIHYVLRGALTQLVIPAPAEVPARRHGLWEETCFELFLAVNNSSRYWEFNLSPAGHWNGYRFTAYRQKMREEAAFTALPFHVESRADALSVALELDPNQIIPPGQSLEVAISAVLKHQDGSLSYWALSHPSPHPDFHSRGSFIVAW